MTLLDTIYDLALKEVGVKRGELHQNPKLPDNPEVVEFYKEAGHPEVKHDAVPWCAAFVGAILHRAGVKPSGSLMARSYLNWGKAIDVPVKGCVVVLSRDKPGEGHVAFFARTAGSGYIQLLGGNQSDGVNFEIFPKTRVLGYRVPIEEKKEVPIPEKKVVADQISVVVPVKSPVASTINWVAISQMVGAIAAFLHVPVTSDNLNSVFSAAMFLFGLYTFVRHTWFEPAVLSTSVLPLK